MLIPTSMTKNLSNSRVIEAFEADLPELLHLCEVCNDSPEAYASALEMRYHLTGKR